LISFLKSNNKIEFVYLITIAKFAKYCFKDMMNFVVAFFVAVLATADSQNTGMLVHDNLCTLLFNFLILKRLLERQMLYNFSKLLYIYCDFVCKVTVNYKISFTIL